MRNQQLSVLVVGSGGREHALALALSHDPSVTRLFCAPGNPGTATVATNYPVDINDARAVVTLARRLRVDLVVIGLLISVPIVVFGSTMVLKLVDRFPIIIYLGAAVLAGTAASMIAGEPVLSQWFGTREAPVKVLRYALMALCVAGVLGTAWLATRRKAAALPAQTDADPQA